LAASPKCIANAVQNSTGMSIGNRSRVGFGSLGLVLLFALPSGARASSDDAWTSFRADVTTACSAQAKKLYTNPIVVVDPFGSDSYGVALIYARTPAPKGAPHDNSLTTAVCVYDKKTHKAELSGGFETGPAH
jgi:hypothetical protein